MDTFRTIVSCTPNPRKIELSQTGIVMGSCFAETVGARLAEYHFPVCLNPTGILYNPHSVSAALRRIISGKKYMESELFEYDGLWHSFDHHGSFSSPDKASCLNRINTRFAEARAALDNPDTLIITLGTAAVWIDKQSGHVTANCHKIPHDRFERRLLSTAEIVEDWGALLAELYRKNPNLNIIVSVSPIRHLRSNPHENSVSKAHLLAALHELGRSFDALYYFPSYEIMMDDLRDYRFYEADMIHPNAVARDYIWMRFMHACMTERARTFIEAYEPILKARMHAINEQHTPATRMFAQNLCSRIDSLGKRFPELDLSRDSLYFRELL